VLIDWFTVGAQVVNFLILVGLMRHFLYRPIRRAIDAREQRIAAELADAAAQKAGALKEREACQHEHAEFDEQRAALLTRATDEAKVERQRLIDGARKDADALSAQRQAALKSEAGRLNEALTRRAQEEVFAIARKALGDLSSTSLEASATVVFNARLRGIAGEAKATLGTALRATAGPALVRSAFELPAQARAAIQQALNETFASDLPLRFEVAPDLIGGIELTAGGQKVAWSISDYLGSLEQAVGQLLAPPAPAAPPPPPPAVVKPEIPANAVAAAGA
jgi:F-type H+-transporting ATPase subunit b